MAKGNKLGHRRFGNIRRLPSGRYQVSYLGPDGQRRHAPETFERKSDAERALVLIEAQMSAGDWTDPARGKVKLADYAATWIAQRPGLRPRSADNYRWLLKKHVSPHLGGVPVGKLSTPMIREWRAALLAQGVSISTAAKAYRFLRAVLMTAVDEDKILPQNPCRIRGAGDEKAPSGRCSPLRRSSSWPTAWAADRSATSGGCRGTAIGFASGETEKCAPRPRSTSAGPQPRRRCGR